jgi:hypothetical protein
MARFNTHGPRLQCSSCAVVYIESQWHKLLKPALRKRKRRNEKRKCPDCITAKKLHLKDICTYDQLFQAQLSTFPHQANGFYELQKHGLHFQLVALR